MRKLNLLLVRVLATVVCIKSKNVIDNSDMRNLVVEHLHEAEINRDLCGFMYVCIVGTSVVALRGELLLAVLIMSLT